MNSLQDYTLKKKVYEMLINRFNLERVREPQIKTDLEMQGKVAKHKIDIYFQFIQMNNLERSIVKVIENKPVTENDIFEFYTVLQDLNFFAKGIIYYDLDVSDEVAQIATQANIELIKFNTEEQVRIYVRDSLKKGLPNEEVIGDPFWTVMEVQDGHNTGNYYPFAQNSIVLFFSKKQAEDFCKLIPDNFKVFGVSQQLLMIICRMRQSFKFKVIIISPFLQIKYSNRIGGVNINNKELMDCYIRGDKDE